MFLVFFSISAWVLKVGELDVLCIGMPEERKLEKRGGEESERDNGLALEV